MRKRADVLGDVVWRCGMGDEERRRERERGWQCGPAMRREERDMGDEAILLPCLGSPLFYVGGFVILLGLFFAIFTEGFPNKFILRKILS